MDFGTWPMINNFDNVEAFLFSQKKSFKFDNFFPVESKSGDGSRELALVFKRNGVKSPKKTFFWPFLRMCKNVMRANRAFWNGCNESLVLALSE